MKFRPIAFVRTVADFLFDLTVSRGFRLNFDLMSDGQSQLHFGEITGYENVRLDIGLSHNAPNAAVWCKSFPRTLVIGIEPNRFNMARISRFGIWSKSYGKRIRRFKPKNFHPIMCAIDDVSNPVMREFYHVRGDSGTSSLLRPQKKFLETHRYSVREVSKVPCVPLASILEVLLVHFPVIELIKVDTQGKDLDVLKSAGSLIQKVKRIVAEVDTFDQYEDSPDKKDIFVYLESQGFTAEVEIELSASEDVLFWNTNL